MSQLNQMPLTHSISVIWDTRREISVQQLLLESGEEHLGGSCAWCHQNLPYLDHLPSLFCHLIGRSPNSSKYLHALRYLQALHLSGLFFFSLCAGNSPSRLACPPLLPGPISSLPSTALPPRRLTPPLPFGYQLGSANGTCWQEIRGWEKG